MTDTKRMRELLTRYEGTGVTYAKAAHADAICALLPALLDENESLKAEINIVTSYFIAYRDNAAPEGE